MSAMTAFLGSSKRATTATSTAPSVAPTMGTSPRNPTATASTAAYGMPTIDIMIQAQNALTAATTTWPIAYDPTRRMISSESESTRGRRLAGTTAYTACLSAGSDDRK